MKRLLLAGVLLALAPASTLAGGDDIIVLAPCPDGETITVKWGEGTPCNPDGDNTLNIVMPGKWMLRRATLTCADVGGRLVWSVCRDVDF